MTRFDVEAPVVARVEGDGDASRAAARPDRARSRARIGPGRRFVNYLLTRGWAHLILLSGVGLFLFPFAWMVGTSLKTDEEVVEDRWFPSVPTFRAQSPYARAVPSINRPMDVPEDRWEALLPDLLSIAREKAVAAPQPAAAEEVDADAYFDATAALLVDRSVAKLNRALWKEPDEALLAAFRGILTAAEVAAAMDDRLARLELRRLQLRTNDARMFNLATGDEIAQQWRIESGGGQLVPENRDATLLRYSFASGSDEPIVLRYDFEPPVGIVELHKLILSLKADDSWHRIDAELVIDGQRWTSRRTSYIAQHRSMSIMFQPPGFDDTTNRAKVWIPLRLTEGEAAPQTVGLSEGGHQATLRLIVSPSSTTQAIIGKVQRNYARAFNSVPFWKYVANSMLLVSLTIAGTLFSSAFVAYAFARLNWPGRGIAFIILLCTMMLPGQVTMIPSFMIWRNLGWYNTLNPMWVPAWFGVAFFIFLMTQQMKTIPRDLEEAARIDGLNAVQTWYYIILPQVKPVAAAIAIMSFMGAWNEFMGPLIYLRDQSKFPLSLGLFGIRLDSGNDWTMIMAGNVLMTLPVIVIFFIFQRHFIQGMTMTGMKG
jgi:multiple sugar transport system permease protein